jgi:hypothetical protein
MIAVPSMVHILQMDEHDAWRVVRLNETKEK